LVAAGRRVHVVGDAVGSGGLEGALADARVVALAIGS
jgi:hypothetical protein